MTDTGTESVAALVERLRRLDETWKVPAMLEAAALLDALAKERDGLGQLLAHAHLHLTNDEDFDADELARDMRNLQAGRFIDTENLLIETRQALAQAERGRDEARRMLAGADAVIERHVVGMARDSGDAAEAIARHRARKAKETKG